MIIVFVEEDFILGVREFILLVLNSEVVIREMDEEYFLLLVKKILFVKE